MGLQVSASTAAAASATTSAVPAAHTKRQQGFTDLASALQSGDLDKAKTAYAALQPSAPGKSHGKSAESNSPMARLGKALEGGDLAAAQQVFSTMRGHHGHRGTGATAPATTQPVPVPAPTTTPVPAPTAAPAPVTSSEPAPSPSAAPPPTPETTPYDASGATVSTPAATLGTRVNLVA